MNRTTYRMAEGQHYYVANKKRIWSMAIALLIILLLISVGFIAKTVTAQSNKESIKLVTSVEVKSGDTLWGIASDYFSDNYSDMNAYIKEIKSANGLTSDDIHAGNYIIVPYYKSSTSKATPQ